MKSGRSNKFSRALGHLKSTTIEEKLQLQLLSEIPINNTQGIYTDEPDRTVTTTLNPNLNPLDLTQDDPAQNGRDTSGLFMSDGTILTEEPPGDTSYILGPMAAMYYTWSYPWTMIGYIRQSDRRMVNLGRIDGKLSDWDGSVGNAGSGTGTFSSYGQLTAEQALWFRDVQKQPGATNHPSTYNYYAFYPGPPSQTPDANGRYPCVITGVSKNRTTTTQQRPTQKPLNPDWGLSGYMFIKNEKTGKWEKKYYRNDGTVSTERSGEMTPDNPFYDAYQRGGGDKAAENGYSREEIIRAGNEDIQREADQQARQEFQDIMRKLERIDQDKRNAFNDPYGNNREKYGPAFGDDQTANKERQKLIKQRNDAIFDYWNNNYVPAPGGAENDPLKDSLYADLPIPDQLRKHLDNAPSYKKTEWGKQLDNLTADPLWGPIIDAAVGAIAMAVGRGGGGYRPGSLARGSKFTVGATGVKQSGYQALKGGQNLHKGSKGILTNPLGQKQVYSAPKVGQRGSSALRPGTGGSRYVEYGSNPLGGAQGKGGQAGGVVGSVVPPRARSIGGPEPQSAVDPKTFQKGQRIFQKAFDPKYAKTPTAQKIRRQATQAGFGDSPNIPASQLPTTSQSSVRSAGGSGRSFGNFSRAAAGVAGALGAADLLAPNPAESGRKLSSKEGQSRIQKELGSDFSLGPKIQASGDHVRYQVLQNGKPVIDPRTNKPVEVGGGVRGGRISASFESGINDFVRDFKRGFEGDVQKGQRAATRKFDTTTQKPVTKGRGLKTGKKVQPKPTTRTTIKSMPARMMGKSGTVRPIVDPANTNPYSYYDPSGTSSARARSALGARQYGVRNFRNLRNIKFSNELEGQMLVENRNRILREIKKETILPDEKKEKLKGYRPKTYGSLHTQYDKLMQKAENPASFKQMDETVWTKRDKYFNSRLSQERKNEVLDHIGTSDHYWDILCETGKKSREKGLQEKYGDYTLVRKEQLAGDTLLFFVDENGKKESILQSEYSDRIARQIEEPLWEQETLNAPNDPLIKRIRGKLATQINYPDKPSPMGYPDGPTPEQVDGYHPEYGKRAAYYNALDPQSADAMPATGDPEIDAKVNAQKTPLLKRVSAIRKKKGKPNS